MAPATNPPMCAHTATPPEMSGRTGFSCGSPAITCQANHQMSATQAGIVMTRMMMAAVIVRLRVSSFLIVIRSDFWHLALSWIAVEARRSQDIRVPVTGRSTGVHVTCPYPSLVSVLALAARPPRSMAALNRVRS